MLDSTKCISTEVQFLKTKKKENKNLLVGLILLLALGFIGVGATALGTTEDLTNHADNQAQAAVPSLVTSHFGSNTWTFTLANSNQHDRNRRRGKKKANQALYKIARDASKGVKDWNIVMSPSKSNRHPGSAEQKSAWKAFGLKTPFARATEVVDQLHFKIVEQGGQNASITSVLIEEFVAVLKRDTQRLADPTFKVSYLLHVCMSLGPAMSTVAKKNATKEMSKNTIMGKLTITPNQLNAAFTSPQVQSLTNIEGYELVIRPFTIKGKPAVTKWLNSLFYEAGNTPFKMAARAEVEKTFDEKVWEPLLAKHQPSHEDSKALVQSFSKRMDDDFGELLQSDDWNNLLPEQLTIIRQANQLAHTIKATSQLGGDAKEHIANLEALFNEFHEFNAKMLTANLPSREEILKKEVDKYYNKQVRGVRKLEHSYEILMTRKEGSNTAATLLWHLSHMSRFKNKGKTFAENDHKGARFLLGPSNGVKIPDAIHKGYLNAIADTSAGFSGRLFGDAVSMQMIQKVNLKPGSLTGVKDKMPDGAVKKFMGIRKHYGHMYTMMNVGLGQDPKQLPHLVLGLYTDPKLVESRGQMTAEVLIKDAARTSSEPKPAPQGQPGQRNRRNQRKRTLGPNTKKNQDAVQRHQQLNEEAEAALSASPEEVEQWMSQQAQADKRAEREQVVAEQERQARLYDELNAMTVAQLKAECKAAGLPVSGKKADLLARLKDNGWLN